MKKPDRSQPSLVRSFFYGFLVTSLATTVLALAAAPRTRDQVVARTTLSCLGSDLDPAKIWNELVSAHTVIEAANSANLFSPSVSDERRQTYLKTNFRMRTREGKAATESLAMLQIQHPSESRSREFLALLSEKVIAISAEIDLTDSVASAAGSEFQTFYVVNRRGDGFVDGPARVRRASLILSAPEQKDSVSSVGAEDELAEARRKLKVARKRYRGLVDAAGRDSILAQNMAYEIDRLEGIVQNLVFVAEKDLIFEPSVVKVSPTSSRSPFQFVAARGESQTDSARNSNLKVTIDQPPHVAETIPGSISRDSLFSVMPFAGGLGLLAGWCFSRKSPVAMVATKDEIAQAVSAPVLGSVFPTRNKVTSKTSNPVRFLGKTMVRSGEFSLFLFVGFVIFCAAIDSSFIRNFLRNPFATYAAAIDNHVTSRLENSNRNSNPDAVPRDADDVETTSSDSV